MTERREVAEYQLENTLESERLVVASLGVPETNREPPSEVLPR